MTITAIGASALPAACAGFASTTGGAATAASGGAGFGGVFVLTTAALPLPLGVLLPPLALLLPPLALPGVSSGAVVSTGLSSRWNQATANAPPPSPSTSASTRTIGHILRGGRDE